MYRIALVIFITVFALKVEIEAQNHPFPQHIEYQAHIKPNQFTQEELDQHVIDFYESWKAIYLINGCESNQYYINHSAGTVSEAMGYGMMIAPLMAGYDNDARLIFDGQFRYFKAHPSHIMPHLMAWKQKENCIDTDGADSATDGDMDIAFGLLLAHSQWGSNGDINYLQEAVLIIKDMIGADASEGDIDQDIYSIKLGDWVQSGSRKYGTRCSDFIMDHFRSFSCTLGEDDTTWDNVIDKCYELINDMQTNYSPESGLLPDFIIDVNNDPKPAPPNYLEGNLDGHYAYNSCRVPWRMGNDYLLSGEPRAKEAVLKINRWLFNTTGGNVSKVWASYHLDGSKAASWNDLSFTAPFTVGAMLDTNQIWLNDLYAKVLNTNINVDGYYGNTLKLLSMLTISGNYWVPDCDIINDIKELSNKEPIQFEIFPSVTDGITNINITQTIGTFKVLVHDTVGNLMQSTSISEHTNTIDISDLKNGMYLISVYDNEGNLEGVRKIVKE